MRRGGEKGGAGGESGEGREEERKQDEEAGLTPAGIDLGSVGRFTCGGCRCLAVDVFGHTRIC